eukprot:TRINITY_DN12347_c1_g6_i6.p1 TRINITY_DN12347_c1_g6~~TRINITY_DN12347_c1_g6_i6.p1  ORF type:complete len:398 (+),score=46.32 TRINITY_DN12347_c1_g6_i6:2-1195(+)
MTPPRLMIVLSLLSVGSKADSCRNLANDVISRAMSEHPDNPLMWRWMYGPSIMMSSMYDLATLYDNATWARFLDARLSEFARDPNEVAYKIIHNVSIPLDTAVGDHVGLFPIAYLGQHDYHNAFINDGKAVVDGILEQYVYPWPLRLNDTSKAYSRFVGWPNQPTKGPSFVWADDQFMGLTQVARYAILSNDGTHLNNAAQMQLDYAELLQDRGQSDGVRDGLMFHGYNVANDERSCCKWGRANGWIMRAHVEVLSALHKVKPDSVMIAPLLDLFKNHSRAMLKVQRADGLWCQVLNESSTFPETSATAMTLIAWIEGVEQGWLTEEYVHPIQLAWQGLKSMIQQDGTVENICAGCGVQLSVQAYQTHSTAYNASQPGLGSVWRALYKYAKFANETC